MATTPPLPEKAREQAPAAPNSLEAALAHVLQVGTYASIGLVALGSLLLLASGGSAVAGGPPLSIDALVADVTALRPAGFLWLGILGVISTPGLRVLRALIGFWRRGERNMAAVAILVLAVIGVGILVGVMAR